MTETTPPTLNHQAFPPEELALMVELHHDYYCREAECVWCRFEATIRAAWAERDAALVVVKAASEAAGVFEDWLSERDKEHIEWACFFCGSELDEVHHNCEGVHLIETVSNFTNESSRRLCQNESSPPYACLNQ